MAAMPAQAAASRLFAGICILKSKKEWAANAAKALKAPIPKAAELLCGLLATDILCLRASTNP